LNISTIPLNVYTSYITRLTPALCNYKYTCSQYARDAIKQHGLINGLVLTNRRLKTCKIDGEQLRIKYNINAKHFCTGGMVTSSFEPITSEEKLELVYALCTIFILLSLLGTAAYYVPLGLELGLAFSYLLTLIVKLYAEHKSITIKLNWTLIFVALVPMLLVSTPSLLIASTLKSLLEPGNLAVSVFGEKAYDQLKLASTTLLVVALASVLVNTTLASILLIACLLLFKPMDFSKQDRVLDNYSLLWAFLGSVAACFNPVYSLVFVALWWQTKLLS
jgi:Putative membrane protein insertion efficiency factor